MVKGDIPSEIKEAVSEKRRELIEAVSEVDEELADLFLNDEPISPEVLSVGFECEVLCFYLMLKTGQTFW